MRRRGARWAAVAIVAMSIAGCSAGSPAPRPSDPVSGSQVAAPTPTSPAPSGSHRLRKAPARAVRPATSTATRPRPITPSPRRTAQPRAAALPLRFPTADATEVITAVAPSAASTQGTVQAWRKVPGGWQRVGPAVPAWFGYDGLSTHPSETRSATPIGSFTLTRAFGYDANPGTGLPYTQTTPADWWISQSGPLYNTMQHCTAGCAFTQGAPNEHLYYETPYYDYAVVIDYNTSNSPTGVVQGAGSAFFLHVTVHQPTQGCISIEQDQLVRILRWLAPARHPRILIGVG